MGKTKEKDEGTGADLDGLIEALVAEKARGRFGGFYGMEIGDTTTGPKMLELDREAQAELVGLLVDRMPKCDQSSAAGYFCELALRALLRRKLPLKDKTVLGLLRLIANDRIVNTYYSPLAGIVSAVENRAAAGPLDGDLIKEIKRCIKQLEDLSINSDCRKAATRLSKCLVEEPTVRIDPGEAWSDVALVDLEAMEPDRRKAWNRLLESCQTAGAGKPSAKWIKQVRPLLDEVGQEDFKHHLLRWFPLVDRPPTVPIERKDWWEPDWQNLIRPPHVDLLKGLAWCAGLEPDRDLARALTALAQSAYRKIPGKGPRLPALGNAVVNALGSMPGIDAVGQLAILKLKVKFIPAQKQIEKALNAAAEREGMPREEIEELAVPTYGMEEVGQRREVLGDYIGEIVVEGQDASLRWSKASDGKTLKSVPAAVKRDHAEEVKDLQGAVKDIGKLLTAQRERIDGLFLSQKQWPFETWRGRYLDHPLVGVIARRLIWSFETDGRAQDGIWLDGRIVGADDRPLEGLNDSTIVRLWHPIGRSVEDVTAWRDWLDRHQVRQPFKQAHREVYVLTDAERNTDVYSNRFAAHILRQHQYHALCAARGWRNRLRMMVDDSYPATSRELPGWGLRAEFWVEGIGDNYGHDTNDSGAYLYLSTDQVRFYEIGSAQAEAHAGGGGYSTRWGRSDAEPVPLERIPPLVLSEILRDVDLFVGVASVGNDPTWSDGGPDGRHVDYWNQYSFGDLSANGQTRKAVLQRLIPRLKIAPRCSFNDRFLVVKGDLRTYKIHLGSGNILMEPNDQYLCIVPKRGTGTQTGAGGVFLPFEGDNTLSIILSKALMLADDTKIKDPTIVSQIQR